LPETVPEVYGVYGAPRSGKDVFAAYLQAHYKDVEVFNFSDGIIAEVNLYLRHHRRFLRTHVITESNKSQPHYRHLLQAWGQARREENVSHWVDAVKREARARTQAGARLVVIAGARVPSDVDAIYELKGVLVRILRPGNTYERAHDVEGALDHWPEASFLTIVNDVEGDLSAFEANIEAALRQPQPAAAPD
jgi:hypothetical protein